MSQQFQPYQTGYQAQTPVGQQLQGSQVGQAIGQRFNESVPQEVQQAVMDLDRFETVVEWAKSKAVERGRPRIAQRCDDLAEIAHLEKQLVLRQSPFAQPIGQATKQTIQQGVQELQAHASQPEVQEALSQGQQTASSIENALSRLQTWGQQSGQQQSSMGQGQQYGQQQSGQQQPSMGQGQQYGQQQSGQQQPSTSQGQQPQAGQGQQFPQSGGQQFQQSAGQQPGSSF